MIGKCVTFDSGGMNIKIRNMNEMKVDMAGSAILMGVLNMTNNLNKNINLLFPIVENYIGSNATRPSTVVKTITGKTVEITDTDAEGRLCIADAIEFFNKNLYSKELKNPLLLDIATLTGNTYQITCSTSGIIMSNEKGKKYLKKMFECGENTKEFVDILILRENYVKSLNSAVSDIKNWSDHCKAGCLVGGAFIDFFVKKSVPWIHLDVASVVYNNDTVNSYGINLLTSFLESI
jgi:leucyl aminopeptidase